MPTVGRYSASQLSSHARACVSPATRFLGSSQVPR